MPRKLFVLISAAMLALSACNLPTGSPLVPQAWIDDPLDGMRLPLKPYTLTLHSSDPLGISLIEVSINGRVLATLTNPDPAQLLVYQTQNWEPTAPGRYVIGVRAMNSAKIWSAEELATVEIEDTSVPTYTPTPIIATLTYTPTATETTTETATGTATPTLIPTLTFTLTPTVLGFSAQVSTRVFNYQRDCRPNPGQVTITVTVTNTAQVRNIYLFFHLKSQTDDTLTGWESVVMVPQGNGKYQTTMVWSEIPNLSAISAHGLSAWFEYQFVADDTSGAILGRSQVFSDIALMPCH